MTLKRRMFTIVAGLGFLAFMGTQVQNMIIQGMQASQQQEQQARQGNQQQLEQLQVKEKGYEAVLEREPKNENALKGLVQTRLDMKDYEGAIPPLEKLVKLNPEQEKYQELLKRIKDR